ncbi:hypothetical protein [Nakamurella endophytica]|uniref:HNH endonuclease n=1 Tax=Nakamurella endophytica TaxID=1748367 RepID=A0A917TAU9_9ACTN|nr:hypothetical protein [Nakamurella endophytica]GGM16228.1 hypothetical protein GCM10011594_40310 [Nakamurella endophytica]
MAAVTTCVRARGRSISLDTERQLWAASAGFCERPECMQYLFHAGDNGKVVTLGQLAHVVAASPGGPRADPAADEQLLAAFDNLIVLCPTCHYVVDHAEEEYPVEVLSRWKRTRRERVRSALHVRKCNSRAELRDELTRLLQFNNAIFRAYGPHSATSDDPLTDAAEVWRREAVEKMVPTNRHIVELLELNRDLLTPAEQEVAADYRVHSDAFEARHVFGVLSASAPRFPDAMNHLLEEDA